MTQRSAINRLVSIFLIVFFVGPANALQAGVIPGRWEKLDAQKSGREVTVEMRTGDLLRGRLVGSAADRITLRTGRGVTALPKADIREVKGSGESIGNGCAIGAAIGFGVTLPVFLGLAESEGIGLAFAGAAFWGLIGALIGCTVDFAVKGEELLFRSK